MLVSEIVKAYIKDDRVGEVGVYIRRGELLWPVIVDEEAPLTYKVRLILEPLGGKLPKTERNSDFRPKGSRVTLKE